MNKNILAVIVSYNPDNSIIKLYNSIKEQVDELIIVDNASTEEESRKILEELSQKLKIIYNNKNLGIATALNQGAKYAIENEYKWLLTLDQDSEFFPHTYETLLASYKNMPDKDDVMLIAPKYKERQCIMYNVQCTIKDNDKERQCTINDKMTKDLKIRKESNVLWKEVILNLTSGSLIKTESFKKIGFFDEKLFIDQVDNDYCYRLKKAGYKTKIAQNILFLHKLGNSKKKLWFIITNHSPIRRYYLARNSTTMLKRYFFVAPYTTVRYFLGGTIFGWIKILLFEKNKFKKIFYGIKGMLEEVYKLNIKKNNTKSIKKIIPLKNFLGKEFIGYSGQDAIDKIYKEKQGYIKNAFYRKDIGYITLAWGNEESGLCHIIKRRTEQKIDISIFLSDLSDIIIKGNLYKNKKSSSRRNIWYNGKIVIIETTYYGKNLNWIVSSFNQRKEPK